MRICKYSGSETKIDVICGNQLLIFTNFHYQISDLIRFLLVLSYFLLFKSQPNRLIHSGGSNHEIIQIKFFINFLHRHDLWRSFRPNWLSYSKIWWVHILEKRTWRWYTNHMVSRSWECRWNSQYCSSIDHHIHHRYHCVSGILVDDGSSCNLIYFRIFTKLDLKEQDLRSCEDQSLLASNDYSTHPCIHMYLLSHLGKNG